jgi:hypothetical protein
LTDRARGALECERDPTSKSMPMTDIDAFYALSYELFFVFADFIRQKLDMHD